VQMPEGNDRPGLVALNRAGADTHEPRQFGLRQPTLAGPGRSARQPCAGSDSSLPPSEAYASFRLECAAGILRVSFVSMRVGACHTRRTAIGRPGTLVPFDPLDASPPAAAKQAAQPIAAAILWSFTYWLGHSEGFRVYAGKRRVGTVEAALGSTKTELPGVLVLRAGILGRQLTVVPTGAVGAVLPRRNVILLQRPPPHRRRRFRAGVARRLRAIRACRTSLTPGRDAGCARPQASDPGLGADSVVAPVECGPEACTK
jgi:hypothetical protein